MKLCVKMLDGRHYVYSDYSFDLSKYWVKVQNKGDCICFPVSQIKEVVEFKSDFQKSLIEQGL